MSQKQFSLRNILVLLIFLPAVLSLKCYVCNSAREHDCGESPPPEKYLRECSHEEDAEEMKNDIHLHHQPTSAQLKDLNNSNSGVPEFVKNLHAEGDLHSDKSKEADLQQRIRRDVDDNKHGIDKMPAAPSMITSMKLPKDATFCRKFAYHLTQQNNGPNSVLNAQVRTRRACGWIPEDKKDIEGAEAPDCKWIGQDGVQTYQCVCTGDGCNGARYLESSLQKQTLTLIAVMIAGYVYVL